jgi:hypothetical protein
MPSSGLAIRFSSCVMCRLFWRAAAKSFLKQSKLVRLLLRMPGIEAVVAHGDPLPPFDFHCPLLSLPLACATELTTIPAEVPYIVPDAKEVAA